MIPVVKTAIDELRYKKLLSDRSEHGFPFRSLDVNQYGDINFNVHGWIYPSGQKLENPKLVISNCEQEIEFPINIDKEVMDSGIKDYLHLNEGKRYIFAIGEDFMFESNSEITIDFSCSLDGKVVRFNIGKVEANLKNSFKFNIRRIDKSRLVAELNSDDYLTFESFENADFSDKQVDVILPIYNGFEYFDKLFSTIKKTNCKYHLYIIDDGSPDPNVRPYLQKISELDEVTLLENERNQGFVRSVNKGLMLANHDVILLNSDTEMPEFWIERLMNPIWQNDKVASVTPFTNSGTICSFPNFCENNEIFLGLSVDDVDSHFKQLSPTGYIIPTGVGFCMALSKKAVDEIGILDAETFGKGYGEENDWCQRAVSAGYINVHLNNLFVYHKHGGSFVTEEKQRLLDRNQQLLYNKHPDLKFDISSYIQLDPVLSDRMRVASEMLQQNDSKKVLLIGNQFGGGATSYLKSRIDDIVNNGDIALNLECRCVNAGFVLSSKPLDFEKPVYKQWEYIINCYYGNEKSLFKFSSVDEVFDFVGQIDSIIINGLQGFPDLTNFVNRIVTLKENSSSKLKYLVHDYFCVCPWYTLTGIHDKYCGLPDCLGCSECFDEYFDKDTISIYSIEGYRKTIRRLFDYTDEIVVFSENSEKIIKKLYPELDNLIVAPHEDSFLQIKPIKNKSSKFTIGIMGAINQDKGFDIICQLADYIEFNGLDARIIIFGETYLPIESDIVKTTGRYDISNINDLFRENPVSVLMFTSTWPETFSFTTTELMSTDLPIVCFDVGASADRIRNYHKGRIIPLESSCKDIYNSLQEMSGR